ncbi:MAG: glycosyl hydrolase-related protein [Planctomycetaceae bacterium]
MTSRTGIVVPHTHWDRAWYLPFQAYRLRLVEMIAALLDLLEQGDLPAFVLDGQTVLLEDHLAIRPQDGPRIRALVEAGRLRLGPWYTMPDCFLARPESLIRNLHRGLRTAADHGGASRVGYVPDSFGHFAQLPQILAGFGIDSFLFMRGMPADVRDRHGGVFAWRAPDGSEVLATFLREGYFPLGALGQESFHGRYDGLPASEERARDRLSATLQRILPIQTQPVVVLPAGGDHLPARGDLVPLVEHLNRSQAEVQLRFGVFEDYLAALRAATSAAPPAVYRGDLLGQTDHPLLRNVLSARVDLKILNHRAQSLLTRVVEPLTAWAGLHGLPGATPALVQHAWDALLKNHAHDDICGCSVDDVHLDDVQRFHDVLALGRELVTRQVEHLVQHRLPPPHARSARVFAFNPHPWPVIASARVRILLPDEGGEFSAESAPRRITAVDAAGGEIPVRVLSTSCKAIRSRYLETTWGRAYEIHAALPLPPLGFEVFTLSETSDPLVLAAVERPEPAPAALLAAVRFELDADLGDGYSHGPCPELPVRRAELLSARADDQLPDVFHLRYQISGPTSIDRDGLASRPLDACLGPQATATITVRAERRWASPAVPLPAAATDAPRDAGSRPFTWILDISFTNVFSDSRLRIVVDPVLLAGEGGLGTCRDVVADGQAMWCPIPALPAVHDLWDGPLAAPAYPGEKPYPVHHTNDGIVWSGDAGTAFCGGAGLHEFELVEAAAAGPPAAAFTLHRAVGSLSVRGGRIRSCQAGPQRATPAAQLLTTLEHVVVCGITPRVRDAMRRLKEALHPCWVEEAPVVPAMSTPVEPTLAASMLEIGDTPLEVMALKPAADGGVVVRLLNPTAEPVTVALGLPGLPAGPCAAERLMLDETTTLTSTRLAAGRPLDLAFAPFEIQTWKLRPC